MLVLSRKEEQTLVIDGQIQIRVLRTSQGVVKLGIEAPRGIQVVRGELLPAGVRSHESASGTRSG